ncbi:MAG: hypothetical protein SFU99_16915 [Saprospiraceae bacterium]|nr:hypothetical protein [Saprospiraceae bacterium]
MKQSFKKLSTIFNLLLVVQLLFCAAALFSIHDDTLPKAIVVRNTNDHVGAQEYISRQGILALVFLLSVVFVAYLIDSQRKAQGAILQGLTEKAEHYRQTSIIRLSLIEVANILAIIVAIKENNLIYLGFVAVGLVLFLRFRPSIKRFIKGYELSTAEAEVLKA